jgi:Cu(I)/Ag(I) efflux system membrane fusion protein
MVRAPGIVQEDERRRSVVSLRFSFMTASKCHDRHASQGPAADAHLRPNLSSAAARYLSALNARTGAGLIKLKARAGAKIWMPEIYCRPGARAKSRLM